jgi:hypothetical protein
MNIYKGPGPVVTYLVSPPIPSRDFDWCATCEGYDEGDPAGWGSTAQEAVDNLIGVEDETY